jgi:CRP/FNR family transcriptional regulator, nitrogen oxide reductase regulator
MSGAPPVPPRPGGGTPLFAGLSDAEVAAVLALAVADRFRPRATLCRQGEPAAQMFLLCSGRAKFVRTTADGRELTIRRLGPGDCFGVGSLVVGPANYMGTAQTLGEGRVYRWDADSITAAAGRYPRLAQNALTVVLQYFQDFGDRHAALLSETAEERLAQTLAHLGATDGRVSPGGVEVEITNRDLGALADVGMYTVSRQLGLWERRGHLVKHRGRILVRRPEALLDA